MTRSATTLLAVAGLWLYPCGATPLAQPARPDAFAFVRALDAAAARTLWPGFNPSTLPIALFDGENTILLRHPSPPSEFSPMAGRTAVFIAPGRYPAVVSNSTRDIGGVRTATVIATAAQSLESTTLATMEEVFHVFWLPRHPSFRPDEMTRYVYPVTDAENQRRVLAEDEALARALEASDMREAARWTAAALDIRRERMPFLTEDAKRFETALEMMEGTANYVARRSVGELPGRTAERLRATRPGDGVRWRFYDTGAALCFLSERLSPGWQERLERETSLTLAELLASALSGREIEPAAFSRSESDRFTARSADSIKELEERRRRLQTEFVHRPGGRIVVTAAQGGEVFRVQRFDPVNLMVLDAGEIAHANFVSLVAGQGQIELTNPRFERGSFDGSVALTVPAGQHPLRDGIRQLTIVGIEGTPNVRGDSDTVTIEAPGLHLTLRGADMRVDGPVVRITMK